MKTNSTSGSGQKKKKSSTVRRTTLGKKKSTTSRNDKVADLSFEVSLMQKASEHMKTLPDVRDEKVRALKTKIKEGTYKVDSKKTADRLIEEHLKVNFEKKK